MRSAPSVSYPVGRSVLLSRLLWLLGFLGLVAVSLGALYGTAFGALVSAVAWAAWGGLMTVVWRRQPQGRLAWAASRQPHAVDPLRPAQAGNWSWFSSAYLEGVVLQRVERVHDLQAWMLLRLHNPDGARTWVWVERRSDPVRWDDLRRALWSHA